MTCPYCRGPLEREPACSCVRCRTPVHVGCARLHGACTTYGCAQPDLVPARRSRVLTAWRTPNLGEVLARALEGQDLTLAASAVLGLAALIVAVSR